MQSDKMLSDKRKEEVQVKFLFIFLLIVLLELPSLLAAEPSAQRPTIEFDYLLHKDETASLLNVRPFYGDVNLEKTSFSDYQLALEDQQGRIFRKVYFPAYFFVFDPFAEVEEIPVTITVPYHDNYVTASLYHKEKRISTLDISFLCRKNNLCEQGENAASCPEDCPASSIDGLCERREDGICDADCIIPEAECEGKDATKIFMLSLPLASLTGLFFTFLFVLLTALRHHVAPEEKKAILKKRLSTLILAAIVFVLLLLLSAAGYLWRG